MNKNVKKIIVVDLNLLNPTICVEGLRETKKSL